MFVFNLLLYMLKEVDKTTSDEPEAQAGWLGQFFPLKNFTPVEDALHLRGVFHAGISSTADVQGRALCPGSTPGAPLYQKNNKPELKVVKWRIMKT